MINGYLFAMSEKKQEEIEVITYKKILTSVREWRFVAAVAARQCQGGWDRETVCSSNARLCKQLYTETSH